MYLLPPGCVRVVADLFNTVYRPLVVFLRMVMSWFPPGSDRVVVDLFNMVYHLLVLFLHLFPLDVSAWWWTYLTRYITYWYCCYCTVRTVMSLFPTRMCPRGGGPI